MKIQKPFLIKLVALIVIICAIFSIYFLYFKNNTQDVNVLEKNEVLEKSSGVSINSDVVGNVEDKNKNDASGSAKSNSYVKVNDGENSSNFVSKYLTAGEASTTKFWTGQELKVHNNKSSCYTVINDKVYDITKYIPMHPGGKGSIMSICGTDGTQLFMGKHGKDKSPNIMLRQMQVGVFAYE